MCIRWLCVSYSLLFESKLIHFFHSAFLGFPCQMRAFIPSLCSKKFVCNIIFSTTISATDLINDNFTFGLHLVLLLCFSKKTPYLK